MTAQTKPGCYQEEPKNANTYNSTIHSPSSILSQFSSLNVTKDFLPFTHIRTRESRENTRNKLLTPAMFVLWIREVGAENHRVNKQPVLLPLCRAFLNVSYSGLKNNYILNYWQCFNWKTLQSVFSENRKIYNSASTSKFRRSKLCYKRESWWWVSRLFEGADERWW